MKKQGLIIILCAFLCGCSTQRNTALTRSYHGLTTHYNVYFNGRESYRAGLLKINENNEDDYSTILPLYPISNHQNIGVCNTEMDLSIEKCRKSIKLHSITVKPKPNPKKANDKKYQLWLQREEFNNQMGKVWIMLGASEFYKGEFESCIGTFNYVIKHYGTDKDVIAQSQLWIARAYGELGWLYDAEEMLKKVNQDDLANKNAHLYSAISADIKLKRQTYSDVIPLIENAVKGEKRAIYKPRFYYVLGQLYVLENNKDKAIKNFKKVRSTHPTDTKLAFNTKLQLAQLQKKPQKTIKKLSRMGRNPKYQDKLDKIYGTIANIYLNQQDTNRAMAYYQLAIDSARSSSLNKGEVLLRLADLCYGRNEFVEAYPLYQEAQTIFPMDNQNYAHIEQRTHILDELANPWKTWKMQDSLQQIASYSPEKQQDIINNIIAQVKAKDRKKKEKQEREQQQAINQKNAEIQKTGGLPRVNTSKMVGTVGSQEWYFYNDNLIKNGKNLFADTWGERALEDNWRRKDKTNIPTWDDNEMNMPNDLADDSPQDLPEEQADTSDTEEFKEEYTVEYYQKQIPKTPEEMAQSNAMLRDALFDVIIILHDKAHNYPLSDELFALFLQKFPDDEKLAELYYYQFLYAKRQKNEPKAVQIKQTMVNKFPENAYTQLLIKAEKSSIFAEKEAQELYKNTFEAFQNGDYQQVITNTQIAKENYSNSPLMPRFLFINSVALAKTQGQESFTEALKQMVEQFPSNELSAKAKDMLAMMGQGWESQQGKDSPHTLSQARSTATDDNMQETASQDTFSTITNELSFVYILVENISDSVLNQLLFEVGVFNFTQFMVKNYDLTVLPYYAEHRAIRISTFENLGETKWYKDILLKNTDLATFLQQLNATVVGITETNAKKIASKKRLEEYMQLAVF